MTKLTSQPVTMKYAIFGLLLASLVLCSNDDRIVMSESLIDRINSYPGLSWTAGKHEPFIGKTARSLKGLLGTFLVEEGASFSETKTCNETKIDVTLPPDNFDSRTKWPLCLLPIRDQGSCGSCWAFSGSTVLSWRNCIATGAKAKITLSPQDMISCDTGDYGCEGGLLPNLWLYLATTGVVKDMCWPYVSSQGMVPLCRTTCTTTTTAWKKYKADKATIKNWAKTDLAGVQNDLMTYGPVQTGYKVYDDFMVYKSGIYQHVTGDFIGAHAVTIVGWGVDSVSKKKYWIVANSWGPTWGESGYFRIIRGVDDCEFENNIYSARAAV